MADSTVTSYPAILLRCALFELCIAVGSGSQSIRALGEAALGVERADTIVNVETLLAQARAGDARASFLLGTRYSSGRAGYRDDRQAVRWFRQAAEAGLAEAQYNLGIMYAAGRGVSADLSCAAHWYEEAAEQGVIEAQFNLGTLYATGSGVPKDLLRAVKWLSAAANNGLSPAQHNLGALYEHGVGVRVDKQAANDWVRSLPVSQYPLQLISHTAEQRARAFIRDRASVKPLAITPQDAMGEPTFP